MDDVTQMENSGSATIMISRGFIITTTLLLLMVFSSSSFSQNLTGSSSTGEFIGQVIVQWIEHDGPDRDMLLLEPITYRDPSGKEWHVPASSTIDGASIPRFFWTWVGPPFVGDYRRASVIHDYFCDEKSEHWRDVHLMFYFASLAGGVPIGDAQFMYGALQLGGPKWERITETGFAGEEEQRLVEIPPSAVSDDVLNDLRDWIQSENPDIDELDAYLDQL